MYLEKAQELEMEEADAKAKEEGSSHRRSQKGLVALVLHLLYLIVLAA